MRRRIGKPSWLLGSIGIMVVVLGVVVVVGRWEEHRYARSENEGMAAIYRLATAHGFISSQLDRYRLTPTFDCLLYHPPTHPLYISAYELCFDQHGRLVEAIDRVTNPPRFPTLRQVPSLATLHVPVAEIVRALTKMGAFRDPRLQGHVSSTTALPLGIADGGAMRIRPPRKHTTTGS